MRSPFLQAHKGPFPGGANPLAAYVIDGDAPTLVMDGYKAVYGLDGVIEPQATVIPLTRASVATCVGQDGLLKAVAVNELRINHNKDGNVLGVLIEASGKNNVLKSEVFGSGWVLSKILVSDNAVTGLRGSVDASTLTGDNTAGAPNLFASHTFSGSDDLVWSGFFKVGTSGNPCNWIAVGTYDLASDVRQYFDIANGVVGSAQNGSFANAGIEDWGNGWYRCWCSRTTAAGGTAVRWQINQATADLTLAQGTDELVLEIQGAMLEHGDYPSSYVLTSGATVTRAKDIPSILTSAFTFSTTAGSVLCEFSASLVGGQRLFSISDGTANNAIYVDRTAGGDITLNVVAGGVSQAAVVGANNVTDDFIKVAVSWEVNDFAITVNGAAVVADAAGSIPTGLTDFSYGMDGLEANQLGGADKQTIYYPKRLSDLNLEAWAAGIAAVLFGLDYSTAVNSLNALGGGLM